MNNLDMVRSYINQAKERIEHAEEALSRGNYPYVVRQCQEAVELLLKASLRFVGIEPPKAHDVGPTLRKESERFPEWFKSHIDELASISRKLREEREFSMYGDEERNIPPELLYTKYDAEVYLSQAKIVLSLVLKLIDEGMKRD